MKSWTLKRVMAEEDADLWERVQAEVGAVKEEEKAESQTRQALIDAIRKYGSRRSHAG